jgi:hypothetical protein
MRKIAFFLRVFENVQYMNDFLDGKIYMNRLSYFPALEGDEEDNRADPREALVAIWQPKDVTIEVNGRVLTSFAGPIESRQKKNTHLHLLCLFTGATSEAHLLNPADNRQAMQADFNVPEKCANLGEYYVVIHNTKKFIDRMVASIRKAGYGDSAKAGMVEYYDPENFTGEFGDRAAFYKTKNFSHQKEYRFVVDTQTENETSLILDIGEIRDIAHISDTWDVKVNIETIYGE